jgi:hypothetical protein
LPFGSRLKHPGKYGTSARLNRTFVGRSVLERNHGLYIYAPAAHRGGTVHAPSDEA